jgi:hypothetical protein
MWYLSSYLSGEPPQLRQTQVWRWRGEVADLHPGELGVAHVCPHVGACVRSCSPCPLSHPSRFLPLPWAQSDSLNPPGSLLCLALHPSELGFEPGRRATQRRKPGGCRLSGCAHSQGRKRGGWLRGHSQHERMQARTWAHTCLRAGTHARTHDTHIHTPHTRGHTRIWRLIGRRMEMGARQKHRESVLAEQEAHMPWSFGGPVTGGTPHSAR